MTEILTTSLSSISNHLLIFMLFFIPCEPEKDIVFFIRMENNTLRHRSQQTWAPSDMYRFGQMILPFPASVSSFTERGEPSLPCSNVEEIHGIIQNSAWHTVRAR